MEQQPQNRRELENAVLEARLTVHLTTQLRAVCVGVKKRHLHAFVADAVGRKMRCYSACPPS